MTASLDCRLLPSKRRKDDAVPRGSGNLKSFGSSSRTTTGLQRKLAILARLQSAVASVASTRSVGLSFIRNCAVPATRPTSTPIFQARS